MRRAALLLTILASPLAHGQPTLTFTQTAVDATFRSVSVGSDGFVVLVAAAYDFRFRIRNLHDFEILLQLPPILLHS